MAVKDHFPNALTCINLLCGCLALSLILHTPEEMFVAPYLIAIAAIADFFDGFMARALRVSSPIGKDLDSLADMVSFGVVPGAILYQLLQGSLAEAGWSPFVAYLAFTVSVFSALRLAKFNNDARQTNSFIGLPTPACTLVVASLPLIIAHDRFHLAPFILNPWVLLTLTFVLSGLLVAELPLFALKFKNLTWQDNWLRFVFLLLSVLLLVLLQQAAVPLIILLYVLLSVLRPSYG